MKTFRKNSNDMPSLFWTLERTERRILKHKPNTRHLWDEDSRKRNSGCSFCKKEPTTTGFFIYHLFSLKKNYTRREELFFDILCLKQLKGLMNQTALLSHLQPPEDGESTRTVIFTRLHNKEMSNYFFKACSSTYSMLLALSSKILP